MKNIFRIVMAVAILFTASCAKEDISSTIGGGEVEVTFTADLGQLGTRAYGEAENVDRVYLGVYEANSSTPLTGLVEADGYAVNNGQASITVVLLKDKKYDLVFWAQNNAQTCYTVNWTARTLDVDYDGALSQDDKRDAFFLIKNGFRAGHDETTFELRRPFAQLRAGISQTDYDYIIDNGVTEGLKKSAAKVYGVANVLNLVNGNVAGEETVTFNGAPVPDPTDPTNEDAKFAVNGENFYQISMNYLLVNEKKLVDVEYNFSDGKTDYFRPYYNVPVQRNYRTNIIGQLISSPMDFNVIINPEFEGDHDSVVDYPEDGKLETLIAPLLGQKEATIVLQSDVTYTTGAGIGSTPLIKETDALKDLVIEGGEISRAGEQPTITFIGEGVGAVRAANGGKITFRNVKIVDLSESYAENAWEYGYLELAGILEFENCTFVNAVMFEGEKASFNNCYFNSNKSKEYALWVSNGNVTVSDSTIEGPRAFKVHEAYGSEVASFMIDYCQFKAIAEKPALAIGDVNAQTAIAIKNSVISAQPGDQGLFIYETDTDVNTFNFVNENNTVTVVVDTYDALQAAIEFAKAGDTIQLNRDITLTEELTLPAGITLDGNGKQINGSLVAGGDVTFAGHTKVTSFSASYYNRIITIGEGACLEVTGGGRVSLAYGNTFNITGSIENAKTADKTSIQPSLIIPAGISITGANDATMNITNAYVQIGSTTSKPGVANGVFTLNVNNSIAEFTKELGFYDPTGGVTPEFKLNVKDGVLTTGTKMYLTAGSTVTVDNSTIDIKTYFANRGEVKLKNKSTLNGATIQFGENGGNSGAITVDNSTFTITAGSTANAYDGRGTGSITAKNGATVNVDYYKDMTITADATSIFNTEVQ